MAPYGACNSSTFTHTPKAANAQNPGITRLPLPTPGCSQFFIYLFIDHVPVVEVVCGWMDYDCGGDASTRANAKHAQRNNRPDKRRRSRWTTSSNEGRNSTEDRLPADGQTNDDDDDETRQARTRPKQQRWNWTGSSSVSVLGRIVSEPWNGERWDVNERE